MEFLSEIIRLNANTTVGSSSKFGLNLLFDWNDHNNAWYHDLQISLSATFEPMWLEIGFPDSFYTTNYLASNKTHYWRVRLVDASGNPGPWSEVRNFFVKPQEALLPTVKWSYFPILLKSATGKPPVALPF